MREVTHRPMTPTDPSGPAEVGGTRSHAVSTPSLIDGREAEDNAMTTMKPQNPGQNPRGNDR